MYIVFGNYGNETIAVCQYLANAGYTDITVVSTDTGWAAESWRRRVTAARQFVEKLGFTAIELSAAASFSDMVLDRKQFPDQKFQWCAGFLKGLTLLSWLDEHDSACEATIILGKCQSGSRANARLPEFIEESEHYGERQVWHPLYQHDISARDQLIEQAGFSVLTHRSLECDPCVNNNLGDFQRLAVTEQQRLAVLEKQVGRAMFDARNWGHEAGIEQIVQWAKRQPEFDADEPEQFDMGCGSPYGCGE